MDHLFANELIAQFMGAKTSNYFDGKKGYIVQNPTGAIIYSAENLLYDKSWDWLMPVLEKINTFHQCPGARRDLVYTIRLLLYGGYGFSTERLEPFQFSLMALWVRAFLWIEYNQKVWA